MGSKHAKSVFLPCFIKARLRPCPLPSSPNRPGKGKGLSITFTRQGCVACIWQCVSLHFTSQKKTIDWNWWTRTWILRISMISYIFFLCHFYTFASPPQHLSGSGVSRLTLLPALHWYPPLHPEVSIHPWRHLRWTCGEGNIEGQHIWVNSYTIYYILYKFRILHVYLS